MGSNRDDVAMKRREHILVIRFSALGDVAMAVPVVYSLAKEYPDLRITVLSRPFARPLFVHLAPNVGFMEADLKREYHGIKGLNALYRRLTAKNFTAIADLHNVLRSEYLRLRFNLGLYRVEHIDKHRAGRRQLVAAKDKVLEQQPTSFQNYADVLRRLGYPIKKLQFKSLFPDGGGDLSCLPKILQTKPQGERWIGVAPFAAHDGKIFPLEKMREVLRLIVQRHPDARLFFFGRGAKEEECFSKWSAEIPQTANVGKMLATLEEELILMSHLDVMLSMDSANMHLASIVGVRVVSVWGATHPYAGFMGWNQPADNAVQLPLPCRPCSVYGNKPCMRGDFACMNGITAEMIADKIDANL